MDHHRENVWPRHQQSRWLRPDAHRWVRSDASRFVAPGKNLVETFPALARKYSADQPRVPAGNPDGGQWTDGTNGSAASTGEGGFGDLVGRDDFPELFQITPYKSDPDGVQLAGDPPVGDGQQGPSEEPPEIPTERPKTSAERTRYFRAAASWLGRNSGLAADIYTGAMDNVEWLRDYHDLVQTARDEPKTLEELQQGVGQHRPGYDDHHIVEQTWAERFGFSRSEIDDPSNLVSIPRLKHYQITGWYGTRSDEFGGVSPREYLKDKGWDERMRIGQRALIRFGVLQP